MHYNCVPIVTKHTTRVPKFPIHCSDSYDYAHNFAPYQRNMCKFMRNRWDLFVEIFIDEQM